MEQPTFNESVSAEIRAEIGRQNRSQRELAIRLGWHQSQLSKRMTGRLSFNLTELEQIAAELGVPVHQLTSARVAS